MKVMDRTLDNKLIVIHFWKMAWMVV